MTTTKPKFFLPGDKVNIKGRSGIFIIKSWSSEHTDLNSDDGEDDDFSAETSEKSQDEDTRDGTDYKYWEYSTTVSAWHRYKDITLVEAGWMRKMI